MRTVHQLLKTMTACPRALKKYANYRRAFKMAFVECSWQDANWLGHVLFSYRHKNMIKIGRGMANDYPRLPRLLFLDGDRLDPYGIGELFQKKANRIKYWPEVKKRLKELGVKL